MEYIRLVQLGLIVVNEGRIIHAWKLRSTYFFEFLRYLFVHGIHKLERPLSNVNAPPTTTPRPSDSTPYYCTRYISAAISVLRKYHGPKYRTGRISQENGAHAKPFPAHATQ